MLYLVFFIETNLLDNISNVLTSALVVKFSFELIISLTVTVHWTMFAKKLVYKFKEKLFLSSVLLCLDLLIFNVVFSCSFIPIDEQDTYATVYIKSLFAFIQGAHTQSNNFLIYNYMPYTFPHILPTMC